MFKILISLFLVATVHGASLGRAPTPDSSTTEKTQIPLLKFETNKDPDGSFQFSYEGGDQSFRQEEGHIVNAGTDDEALEVSGSYRYIDADGQLVEVRYTAGKNGFVPIGTNILGEISALAKAAADLPNTSYEEEQEQKLKLKQRRARSDTSRKNKSEKLPEPAESQIVQVKVLVDEKPAKVEKLEKSEENKKSA